MLRISGVDAAQVVNSVFEASRPGDLEPWRLRHGWARDIDSGDRVDEVLAVFMPGPQSYTGEDCAEIHCHGSLPVIESIVSLAIRAGARAAERGEFSRRAVLNGKMDLVQAEAVADLVDARVDAGAAAAWAQLQGALSRELESIRKPLMRVLADVEVNIDFSEEELPEESLPARLDLLDQAGASIGRLLSGFAAARRRRDGWKVVFCGRPNAGKSSLINALLGHGRMIVSDEPGTTRDVVEEVVDLGGIAFVLTDTAGIRSTSSSAESAAIERAAETVAEADILVQVIDRSQAEPVERLGGDAAKRIVVLNKSDLEKRLGSDEERHCSRDARVVLEASAVSGDGLNSLAEALVGIAQSDDDHSAEISGRVRHRVALLRAKEALQKARRLLADKVEAELAALELREVITELSGITHPLDNEELLDVIFRDFCIGK